MSYAVTCGCGTRHPVSATQAGSTLSCACGRSIEVPPLSDLRSAAGESAIPLNTIEEIRVLVRRGELPNGSICPYSDRPANATLVLLVKCEQMWVRGGDRWRTGSIVAAVLFCGWIGALLALFSPVRREELGRDTVVEVPVRISSDLADEMLRIRQQKKLKSILRKTPIYAKLLEEFPRASVQPLRVE